MGTTNYSIDYFIKKFEAIPSAKWTTSVFSDWMGNSCALGHCMPRHVIEATTFPKYKKAKGGMNKAFTSHFEEELKECKALCLIFDADSQREGSGKIIKINNGENNKYRQSNPKARILAALTDLKKSIQPVYIDITKSLATLTVNETSDLIKAKQIAI